MNDNNFKLALNECKIPV